MFKMEWRAIQEPCMLKAITTTGMISRVVLLIGHRHFTLQQLAYQYIQSP